MARQEITVTSSVKFRDTGEVFTMEEVNANPILRAKADERLKAVLEQGLPTVPGIVQALFEESKKINITQ